MRATSDETRDGTPTRDLAFFSYYPYMSAIQPMSSDAPSFADYPLRNVRLDTLIRLRWLAVFGQTAAVLIVSDGLDYVLPLWPCLAVIGLYAWLNIALRLRFRGNARLEPDRCAWLL